MAILFLSISVGGLATAQESKKDKFTDQQLEFFESKIRPLLVKRCYECHGPESDYDGGLGLVSRSAILEGGDSGAAIDLDEPKKSLLLDAINYGDLFQMPPDSKMPDKEIALLKKWVEMGAPWPDSDKTGKAKTEEFNLENRIKEHWCWQPIQPPKKPVVKNGDWPIEPLDYFIIKKLEEKGFQPQRPADKRTWIRRVYFDLIGLPPSAEQVETFLNDTTPQAFSKVVDQLLASEHFGERWARHWMDLVRYAETCGHEFDYPLPHAHQYRDYLIRAFNEDVPYNQFVKEHIAGDLLPSFRQNKKEKYNESILGTGFWFLGEATHGPVDSKGDEAGRIDNQIDVMSKTFLGLTVACARCHDHKFDAISTADYYALSGYLQSSRRQDVMLDRNGLIEKSSKQANELLAKSDRLVQAWSARASKSSKHELARYLEAAIRYSQSNRDWRANNDLTYQGESLQVVRRSGGESLVQKLRSNRKLKIQGDKQIWWYNTKVGDELVLKFSVINDGKYDISANFVKAVDYGIAEIYVDGKKLNRFDLFNPEIISTGLIPIGQTDLKSGDHELMFKIVGTNPKAVAKYMVGMDYLHLKRVSATKPDTNPRLTLESLAKEYELELHHLKSVVDLVEDPVHQQVESPWNMVYRTINHRGPIDQNLFARLRNETQQAAKAASQSRENTTLFANFEDGGKGWFRTGHGFDPRPTHSASLDLSQPDLHSLPGTWSSGRKGKRFYGVLRSPTFKISHKHVHYRMNAENVRIRLIVDGFTMDIYNSLLFNGLTFNHSSEGQYRWKTQGGDLRNHIGKNAHIEIIDHGQGFASIDEIVFSNEAAPRDAPSSISSRLVAGEKLTLTMFCERLAEQILVALSEQDLTKRDNSYLVSAVRRHGAVAAPPIDVRSGLKTESFAELQKQLDDIQAELLEINKKTPSPFFAVGMTDGTGENEHVFIRGNHKNLGKVVSRRLPTALDRNPPQLTPGQGSGRLLLANKMVSDNPLTKRVIVNRLWHHVFGKGIVPSVDNFGVLGEAPTHPELLDFLAIQFEQDGWSIKKTLRRFVLSQTYRMSSVPDPAAVEKDPANNWLHHMRRRRLQGEAIRDSMLVVSGELDRKMFGPSVKIHLTEFMQGRGRPGGNGPLDGARRRSIYTESRRNFLPPMMLAFDTPVPFNTIGRRTSSNVPAQALILMNDPFVILQAEKWAEKLVAVSESRDERIRRIYEKAFSRKPTDSELKNAMQFLDLQAKSYRVSNEDQIKHKQLWADYCHVIFNVKEFIFLK